MMREVWVKRVLGTMTDYSPTILEQEFFKATGENMSRAFWMLNFMCQENGLIVSRRSFSDASEIIVLRKDDASPVVFIQTHENAPVNHHDAMAYLRVLAALKIETETE